MHGERYKKFIISQGMFIMGQVELHRDLCSDHSETKGGGWWHVDNENKKMYLYSSSEQFGVAKKEDVELAIKSGRMPMRLKEYDFYYSTSNSLGDVLNNGILLNTK